MTCMYPFFSRSVWESAEKVSWAARVGVKDCVSRRFDGGSDGRSSDHHHGDYDDSRCERGRSRCCGSGHRDRRQCTSRGRSDHDWYRAGRSDRDQWRVHIVRCDCGHIAGTPDQLRLHGRADQDTTPKTRGLSSNYFLQYIILMIIANFD